MSQKISITVLVENSVHERGLKAEHGLAWHIQLGSQQVLFDTGQSDLLVENARQLGIGLDRLDAIILSHGHYDHTGGLAAVVAASSCPPVFLHPAAREPKFSLQPDGTPRFIGLPKPAALSSRALKCGSLKRAPVRRWSKACLSPEKFPAARLTRMRADVFSG